MQIIYYTDKIPMREDTLYLDLDNDLEWVQLKDKTVHQSENAGEIFTDCLGSFVQFEERLSS